MNLSKLKDIRFLSGTIPYGYLRKHPLLYLLNWLRFKLELVVIKRISKRYGRSFEESFSNSLKDLHKKEQEDILVKKLSLALYNRKPKLDRREKYQGGRKKSAVDIAPEEKVKYSSDRLFKVYSHRRRRKYGTSLYKVMEEFEEVSNAESKQEESEERISEKSGGAESGTNP